MTTSLIRKPRTLVLCFDGTSNEYDANNTNVVKLFALIKKDDFDEQHVYYQPGIGTWFKPGVVSPLFEWMAKIMDLAFAWYLDTHVMDGYRFLMQNYRVGDTICIFGFSRGAYTARALAGLLFKVGLLPRDNIAQLPFAYKMYKRTDPEGLKLCAGFKQTYCRTVIIDFMGVWDTVSSVGVLKARTLPFTNSNSSIRVFRHALALDERRAKFRPNRYHRMTPAREAAELDPEQGSPVMGEEGTSKTDKPSDPAAPTIRTESPPPISLVSPSKNERRRSSSASSINWKFWGKSGTGKYSIKDTGKAFAPVLVEPELSVDVKEVWFPGCHCDTGAGATPNEAENSLGNISLRWMIREIVASGCGMQFDHVALKRAKIKLDAEPSPSQIELDKVDALEPINNAMKESPMWWLLEILPLPHAWQDEKGVWHREIRFNMGKGRNIVEDHPTFHSTVKRRMELTDYRPSAQWKEGSEVYVE